MKRIEIIAAVLVIASLSTNAQIKSTSVNSKMDQYVSGLMQKMTLDEKIGQLNLLTPGGGVATGAVVSSDVESKIKAGSVGGLFFPLNLLEHYKNT